MDREKIIKAIECCVVNHVRCFDDNDKLCPYFSTKVYMCEIELLKDALALLKEQEDEIAKFCGEVARLTAMLEEQEAVKIKTKYYDGFGNRISLCPSCNATIRYDYDKCYCGFCGKKVKWE